MPYTPEKTFSSIALTPQLRDALSRQGVTQLSPMQEAAAEACQGRDDVVLLAPTGSGKTLAYLLPLCGQLDAQSDALQAVIVVPSRELAMQIDDVFRSLRTPLCAVCCYGGRPAMEEHRVIRSVRPQLVIATPGRLCDHLAKDNLHGPTVRSLIVDEFDKCLELGFRDEMNRLVRALPGVRRTVLTSATDSDELGAFLNAVSGGRRGVERLDYLDGGDGVPAGRIRSYVVRSPENDKLDTLIALLGDLEGRPSVVFVGYRESVDRVADALAKAGFSVERYHGGMEQQWRERAVYKFRSGCSNVLVSTDLAARGLDVPEVEAVVHYHLPADQTAYVHRVGRTGRWEADGCSYLILNPKETLPEYLDPTPEDYVPTQPARRPVAPRWVTVYIGRGKKDKLSRVDIVGFFCKKGGLRAADIGRIDVKDRYAYAAIDRLKVRAALRAVAGEKIKGMRTLVEVMRH